MHLACRIAVRKRRFTEQYGTSIEAEKGRQAMSELMRYKGRRSLITGVSLEPGQIYKIDPLDRKYGRNGFWVEVSDGKDKCRCPYENSDIFLSNWEVAEPGTR